MIGEKMKSVNHKELYKQEYINFIYNRVKPCQNINQVLSTDIFSEGQGPI